VTNFIKNGEWNLIDLNAILILKKYSCCDESYPEVHYNFIIRRRPLYYVFNMVFPCLLITLVAFLGFYLPPGSSEKVSIGITTLLSITVFLMLVSESMPPTSEHLPLLGIYYAVTIGIVSFSTAMAVVTLHINNKGSRGKKVPRVLKIIFLKYLAKIVRTDLTNARLTYLKKKYNLETLEKLPNVESVDQLSTNYILRKNSFKRKFSLNSEENVDKQIKIDIKNENTDEILLEVIDDNQYDYRRIPLRSKDEKSQYNQDSSEPVGQKLMLRSTPIRKNDKLTFSTSSLYHKCQKNDSQAMKIKILEEEQAKLLNTSKELSTSTLPIKQRSIQNLSPNYNGHSPHSCSSCKRSRRKSIDHAYNMEFLGELEKLLQRQFSPLVHHVIKQVKNNEKRLEDRERLEIIEREWSDVAMIFDHMLCYLFCFITLTSTFLIFTNSPHVLSNW
jgi:hypothetical protein